MILPYLQGITIGLRKKSEQIASIDHDFGLTRETKIYSNSKVLSVVDFRN